jgi:uncharacterized secreted protein with C-terminal beta-propeller domain
VVAGVAGFLALAGLITTATLVLGSSEPAAAADLVRFESCAELEAWTTETMGGGPATTVAAFEEAARAVDSSGSGADGRPAAAPLAADETAGAATSSLDTGGTNTVVAGVDEIDVIDRIGADRLLVSRNGALALVDLSGRTVVAALTGIPYDARISVAGDVVWVAGSSPDGLGTTVQRLRLDGDAFVDDGTWSTPGWLLDARRTGDRLHVVVVDQPFGFGVIPFEGGPVPCEDVWRPTATATSAAATLVASLPAEGTLSPVAAAEVTGSAGNLLVTDDSMYIATETWPESDGGQVTTGVHRFDLETLAPTGSGSVPGTIAGRFALDEHDGHLRVATSLMSFGPAILEGDVLTRPTELPAVDVVVGSTAAPAVAAASEEPSPTTETTVPVTTETTAPVTSTTIEAETTTTTTEPVTTETTVPETTTSTEPESTTTTTVDTAAEDALAEVFVLDTEGDLDIVGRSGRFGRDFETIQGVRFVGDVAYVVTFLQTDPFWVVDLAEPSSPRVVGELFIEGFSAYLHPVGDGLTVGFGPDGQGGTSARLFDVTDPANPRLRDEIRLGDDSTIVWDSHAFVALDDGTFAVPATDWPDVAACAAEPGGAPVPLPEPLPVDPGIGGGTSGSTGIAVGEPVPFCEPVFSGGSTGAVVLGIEGGRLVRVATAAVETDGSVSAERVVRAQDGTWLLLSWDRIVPTDGGAAIVLPADPSTGIVVD